MNNPKPSLILVDCRNITLSMQEAIHQYIEDSPERYVEFFCLHGELTDSNVDREEWCCQRGERKSVQRAVCNLAKYHSYTCRLHIFTSHHFKISERYRYGFATHAENAGLSIWTEDELVETFELKTRNLLGSVDVASMRNVSHVHVPTTYQWIRSMFLLY